MGRLLIAVLAVALTAAGCAAEAPGQPVAKPSDSSTTPPTSQSSAGAAPPIKSPELDLTSYESRACNLLTSAQLAEFAIDEPGKPDASVVGPACKWSPSDTTAGTRLDVAILSNAKNGWDGVYERRANFPFFEEAGELNGYPAVHLDAAGDGTAGTCGTTVGVGRDRVFEASVFINRVDSPEYKDPCSVSDRVAGLVIDTLKGGR